MGYYLKTHNGNRRTFVPLTTGSKEKKMDPGMHPGEKNVTEILSNGMWKGHRCFLIGGGPSLSTFDPELIRNEYTIGINKAFIRFNTSINYGMDSKFYDYVSRYIEVDKERILAQEIWKEYQGVKLFLKMNTKIPYTNVYTIKKIQNEVISLNLTEGIFGGDNSGFGALMLAMALEANPIYLIGYDMRVHYPNLGNKDGMQTHWHKGYDFKGKVDNQMPSKLDKFKNTFEKFVPTILDLGVKVVNLNPDSALDCFPKSTISEVFSG